MATSKKPSLGRGLNALMGSAETPPPAAAVLTPAALTLTPGPAGERLARLPLDILQRGRYQPRSHMDPEALEELAASIRSQGVVQPIVVRPIAATTATGGQRYEIVAGERRWRAAQLAGLADIAAIVRDVPDETAISVALIENIQREDLNPLEEARALERLISEFNMTHQQAAEAVGRSRAAVSNLLRLLDLAPEVGEQLEARALEMGHARALLGLSTRRQQVEVASLVVKKGLSVRETEAIVRRMSQSATDQAGSGKAAGDAAGASGDPDVQRLEQDLAEKLGARVAIQHSRSGKGKLVVSYNSLDELDGILEHIR
ncbi:MAG TPA: ParB/RepB/Spo0J family partition protein [Steroidobacteraceae bacterium]|jgi:ParB family chromosome partitioning protein|nr:ParB/RepB/Spo0J family partition protein [Steroidobacteraceae bacterium]